MVLEKLMLNYFNKKNISGPISIGLIYTITAIFLSLWIFKSQTSLLYIFFVVLASAPVIYKSIANEEINDFKISSESERLKSHSKIIGLYLFLFIGITIGTALSYIILPGIIGNDNTFSLQEGIISQVRGPTGNVTHLDALKTIFFNNFKVMLLCLIFSFLYGFGALFILTWNASIVGVAMGNTIITAIDSIGSSLGMQHIPQIANIVSLSLIKYFTHGIFEIGGYITMGLAGGIISYSIIKNDFKEIKLKTLFSDVYSLILISFVLIVFGSLIEVFITPALI